MSTVQFYDSSVCSLTNQNAVDFSVFYPMHIQKDNLFARHASDRVARRKE